MRFVCRTVVHLAGISALPSDPLTLLSESTPLSHLDAAWVDRLKLLGLGELNVGATISMDQLHFREVDDRTALANRLLDGFFAHTAEGHASETADDLRLKRSQEFGSGAWLVIDITGVDGEHVEPPTELDPEFNLSYQLADTTHRLSALNDPAAHELYSRIVGAICIAAQHPVRSRAVGRCWWYVRPDGRPHHLVRIQPSARGTVSIPLRADTASDIGRILSGVRGDARLESALGAFGQSLAWDVDPALEFLAAFTGLELIVKSRSGADVHTPSASRRGLAKRFERLVGTTNPDCAIFDTLYAERNGLAHEARRPRQSADAARRLFEGQLRELVWASLQIETRGSGT